MQKVYIFSWDLFLFKCTILKFKDIYLFDVIMEFVLIGWQDQSWIDKGLFLVFIIPLIVSVYEYMCIYICIS